MIRYNDNPMNSNWIQLFWRQILFFFRLESADSIAEKNSIYLESMALMVTSKSDFTRFLVFSIRFTKTVRKKKLKTQSLLTNKFRNEQIIKPTKAYTTWTNIIIWCDDTRFFKMIGVGCFAAKTKKHNRKLFFNGQQKNGFCVACWPWSKWMGQKNEKESGGGR